MVPVAVECRFHKDGTVAVSNIQIGSRWVPIEQGRQWLDSDGRHVAIRQLDGTTAELILNPETLAWRYREIGSRSPKIV